MAQEGELITFDQEKAAAINLAVLTSRVDRAVESIVAVARHTKAYEFDCQKGEWEQRPIEGPLFLVQRYEAPTMRLILLNRLSPTNLKFDVEASTSSTLQDDMLSLRTAEGAVCGFWSYHPHDLRTLRQHIKSHCRSLRGDGASPAMTPAKPGPTPPSTPTTPHSSVMSLLQAASHSAATPGGAGGGRSSAPPSSTPSSSMAQSMADAAARRVAEEEGTPTPTPLALSKAALRDVLVGMLDEPDFLHELHSRFIAALQAGGLPATPAPPSATDSTPRKGGGKASRKATRRGNAKKKGGGQGK